MINYPNKKPLYKGKSVSKSNRGMTFESLIDESNTFYLVNDIAVIHKKPTPVQIVNVDYPMRTKAKITEAYYKTPSTTDYNGIYKGYYIDFDVKETRNKTSFPLKNIHDHQINHLKQVHNQQGIAFILIYFKVQNTFHYLPYTAIKLFVERAIKGRKSITYEEVIEHGFEIKEGYRPTLDYLKVVDMFIKK